MYVAAESYKFVRLYPLGMGDLPVRQSIIRFDPGDGEDEGGMPADEKRKTEEEEEDEGVSRQDEIGRYGYAGVEQDALPKKLGQGITSPEDAVDFTPPNLISALITENGVLTPSAVSEELIKLWF